MTNCTDTEMIGLAILAVLVIVIFVQLLISFPYFCSRCNKTPPHEKYDTKYPKIKR